MKIHKGDQVIIIKGKDKGKKGKVLRGFPKETKVLVEGVNIKKVHKRPKKEGEKGQVVEVPAPIHISKLKLICPKCAKPVRVDYIRPKGEYPQGYKLSGKKKSRVCKKCGSEI